MRFRRALDRQNVTEAVSGASELPHVGLAEALELCLLLRDKPPERYPRAAMRWHGRLCREVDVSRADLSARLPRRLLPCLRKRAFKIHQRLRHKGMQFDELSV